ncbi:PEBP-like protein [Clathrospora elynae]|uniref:PEBP-like protein n=1 Tax=Clathrospora elynae TaxID=706981 RepID=A0A6A5T3A5_9PLEO|nr:PEBP-like protein [Clathrospora elynae]
MVDLDVPSNNSRVQLVHWLATNVTRLNTSSTASLLNIPAAPVPYLQPSPPVGDVPHSYSFVLFPQPANFSIPAQYSDLADNRVGFNVSRFVADAGLGGALAGNWITVQNLTGTATMEFPPARPTATATGNSSTSMPPFEGGATPMRMGGLAGWLGVGTAVFAGVAAFGL